MAPTTAPLPANVARIDARTPTAEIRALQRFVQMLPEDAWLRGFFNQRMINWLYGRMAEKAEPDIETLLRRTNERHAIEVGHNVHLSGSLQAIKGDLDRLRQEAIARNADIETLRMNLTMERGESSLWMRRALDAEFKLRKEGDEQKEAEKEQKREEMVRDEISDAVDH